MERKEQVSQEKWELGPGPFVLSGPPPVCEGTVELVNRSEEELELTAIAIRHIDLKSQQSPGSAAVGTFARLGPHDRSRVAMRLTLDHTTPPGRYTGELCCGSQREQVLIQVLENWDLRIVPQSVIITASPGEKLALRVLITNLGNIEFNLQNADSIYLDDDQGINRLLLNTLNTAIKEAGKQGFGKFLDRFVQEWAEAVVSPATVKSQSEGRVIRPGESKEVKLEIQLPEDLKKNKVYRGRMRFKNAALVLEVECTGAPEISPRRQK